MEGRKDPEFLVVLVLQDFRSLVVACWGLCTIRQGKGLTCLLPSMGCKKSQVLLVEREKEREEQ